MERLDSLKLYRVCLVLVFVLAITITVFGTEMPGERVVVAHIYDGVSHDPFKSGNVVIDNPVIDSLCTAHGVVKVAGLFPAWNESLEVNTSLGDYVRLNMRLLFSFELAEVDSIDGFLNDITGLYGVSFAHKRIVPVPMMRPNDPMFLDGSQWYLEDDIEIEAAWDISTGDPTTNVGILDMPADNWNVLPEFMNQIMSDPPTYYEPEIYPDQNHAYALAGIIGAETDNGHRMAGINHNGQFASRGLGRLRYTDPSDPSTIELAVQDYLAFIDDPTLRVINNSYAWMATPPSPTQMPLEHIFFYHWMYADNRLLTCAMGNNEESEPLYPAKLHLTMGVGAYDNQGAHYGRFGSHTDIVAPAEDINTLGMNEEVISPSGTSLSTAMVSGVAALLWSHYPDLHVDDVREILKLSAEEFGSEDPDFWGAGRLNARRALEFIDDLTYFNNDIQVRWSDRSWGTILYDRLGEDQELAVFRSQGDTLHPEWGPHLRVGEGNLHWYYCSIPLSLICPGQTFSEPPYVWARPLSSTGVPMAGYEDAPYGFILYEPDDIDPWNEDYAAVGWARVTNVTETEVWLETYRASARFPRPQGYDIWSTSSNPWFGLTVVERTTPFEPANLQLTSDNNNHPHLTWSCKDHSRDIDHYKVYRKTDPDPQGHPQWHYLASTQDMEYTDTEFGINPQGGTEAWYKVYAVDEDNNQSDASRVVDTQGVLKIMSSPHDEGPTFQVNDVGIQSFKVFPNYPNPANPETSLRFQLPEQARVTISIYNMQGQLVKQVVDRNMGAGTHSVAWNGTSQSGAALASGMYIYTVHTKGKETGAVYRESRKLVLLK